MRTSWVRFPPRARAKSLTPRSKSCAPGLGGTPAGEVARALAAAEHDLEQAQVAASDPRLGMFGRRRAAREVAQRRVNLASARQQWDIHAAPVMAQLHARRQETMRPGYNRSENERAWVASHPTIANRLRQLSQQIVHHAGREHVSPHVSHEPQHEIDIGL